VQRLAEWSLVRPSNSLLGDSNEQKEGEKAA
jgi:hypothetical protein